MDKQKSKILLQKINRLFDSIMIDDQVSKIEEDLMLQYVRDFYDALKDSTPTAHAPQETIIPPKEQKIKTEASPLDNKPVEAVHKNQTVENFDTKSTNYQEIEEKSTPIKVEKTTPPSPPPQKIEPQRIERHPKESQPLADAAHELFEQKEVKEISEKLSQSPIKDLSKIMGINDKLHTISELFGGDAKLYEQTMTTLNGFHNFEEAKHFLLENIATRYDWTLKTRKEKAKEFIKLVRRRYL